jgi:SAM-dependent methyltransferase
MIFDRKLYLARQELASAAQEPLLSHVAGELADRLSVINHNFENVALIAGVPEPFAAILKASGKCSNVQALAPPEGDFLSLPAARFDAVFSLLDLHCVNDVPGYLAQCARSLKPDGLFMACCFAGETLAELRNAWLAAEAARGGVSPRVAPMIGTREMGALLQRAGLALPVADNDHLVLRYADPLALMREVKAFGFANVLSDRRKGLTAPVLLAGAVQDYAANNSDADGRVRAGLDLLWVLAWKPHESQPQPKKPGSATVSLEEALRKFDAGN